MLHRPGLTSLALLAAFALLANRAPPKWQAFGKVPIGVAAKCAEGELAKFGPVRTESGDKPEEGTRRLFLLSPGKKHSDRAVIYMDGEPRFAAMWMDAENSQLGNNIWHAVTRRCGVH